MVRTECQFSGLVRGSGSRPVPLPSLHQTRGQWLPLSFTPITDEACFHSEKKKSMLFLIWALNFVRTFFASVEMIIWFIFILQFVNVIYHIDWFAYINQWAPIVFKHCYQALEDTQIESWCPQPANVYSLLKKTGKHMHNDNAGCTLLSWR